MISYVLITILNNQLILKIAINGKWSLGYFYEGNAISFSNSFSSIGIWSVPIKFRLESLL